MDDKILPIIHYLFFNEIYYYYHEIIIIILCYGLDDVLDYSIDRTEFQIHYVAA